jgi:hypothetical protein
MRTAILKNLSKNARSVKMSKSNCISLNKGEKAPNNGVLISQEQFDWYEEVAEFVREFRTENPATQSGKTIFESGKEGAVSSSLPEEEAMIE